MKQDFFSEGEITYGSMPKLWGRGGGGAVHAPQENYEIMTPEVASEIIHTICCVLTIHQTTIGTITRSALGITLLFGNSRGWGGGGGRFLYTPTLVSIPEIHSLRSYL